MNWASGFAMDLDEPYKVSEGDRYVIEWDVMDITDPMVSLRPAVDGDVHVLTAKANGVITQIRISLL